MNRRPSTALPFAKTITVDNHLIVVMPRRAEDEPLSQDDADLGCRILLSTGHDLVHLLQTAGILRTASQEEITILEQAFLYFILTFTLSFLFYLSLQHILLFFFIIVYY